MASPAPSAGSIRRRMLLFLISAAALMVSGATLVTYFVALHSANAAYDRSLLDPAFDIADNVRIDASGAHVDLPQKALEALVYDQADKVVYQIRAPDGRVVDGVPGLPMPPAMNPGEHAFFDAEYEGDKMRVAALRSASGFVVQIGETLHKRNRLIGEIVFSELGATLVVALGSIGLAWVGVTLGLKPLERLRLELLRRTPTDLQPLEEAGAPVEIAPVVRAFNRLLESLRGAIAIQRRFLANAAHQLRTPLAGLQVHLELLSQQVTGNDLHAQLDQMHIATVRASRLANQLLALAKAESAAEHAGNAEMLDLRTIAGTAARDWAPRAFNDKIDLGFDLNDAVVMGYSLLLPELLDNLIDNALRYTPEGGQVTVATGCVDGAAFLSVSDSGPGIPAEERSKVIERFYRVAGTRGEGSGLGLAIVREVTDRHDAELIIDTCPLHGGARVSIRFAGHEA